VESFQGEGAYAAHYIDRLSKKAREAMEDSDCRPQAVDKSPIAVAIFLKILLSFLK